MHDFIMIMYLIAYNYSVINYNCAKASARRNVLKTVNK